MAEDQAGLAQSAGVRRRSLQASREDFDCTVCHELLLEPCVPTCGHPFCRRCLQQLLRHHAASGGATRGSGLKCPVCRRVLHVTRAEDLAVCGAFDNLLKLAFPEDYEARRAAAERSAPAATGGDEAMMECDGGGPRPWLPIFVLDATLPKQHLHLNIFEPRYLLMTREALQGSRRFGMAGFSAGGAAAPYGVEVEIVTVQEQLNGNIYLEAVGRRPIKMLETTQGPQGLLLAAVEYVDVEAGGEEGGDDVGALAAEVVHLVKKWELAVREGGWERRPNQIDTVLQQLGPRPPNDQPGALAMWVGALANPLPALGVAPEIRPALLAAESPAARIRVARDGLQSSIERIETANRSWMVRAVNLVPRPLHPFIPFLPAVLLAAGSISLGEVNWSWLWPSVTAS
eukprot:TRINITY_DN15918_c0_g1_i1.p1 TRINITY_DN15918_c0_g1~~TRINITY_DN15918_c0_g1_i1.p1  ORF type:complete len:401 (-),score=93.72 TRINITY_DN15918_c0_g1_i1:89-1291(-)